jgi:16S rRNA (guanine527-N7)-methyltransferase
MNNTLRKHIEGITNDQDVAIKLQKFVQLMNKWNLTYRLVGSVDEDELYDKHFFDAHMLGGCLRHGGTLVDIGAGAGLPTLPLKMLRDDLTTHLIEPQQKRVNFCQRVISSLSLDRAWIVRGRAEEMAVIESVGKCDYVISRATWKLPEFLKMATPYLADGGSIIALKGKDWKTELETTVSAMSDLKLSQPEAIEYTLPISGTPRAILKF